MSSIPMREPADLQIEPRWLLPMTGPAPVLEGHAVVIDSGRILAVGERAAVSARYAAREVVRRDSHVLLPGLINAHTRASSTLLRAASPYPGIPSSVALTREADFARDGTRLAFAQMLRAGITCVADLSPHPEETARLAAQTGMRACIALPIGAESPEGLTAQLARAERLWDQYRSDARITLFFALLPEAFAHEATLSRVRRVADELDAQVALCLGPAPELPEVRDAGAARSLVAQAAYTGLLRPGCAVIGSCGPQELELIARHGATVIACPRASLGARPGAVALLEADRTALGSGDPEAAGGFDLLAEARTAAQLSHIGAARALRMATLGGATALGLHSRTGSIEPGKAADLCCIALEPLTACSFAAIEDALLLGSSAQGVSDVFIAGRPLVREQALLGFDADELERTAQQWRERLRLTAAA